MVSIIIVNYNTSSLLLDCINSIYRQTRGTTFEIIVADNNSSREQVEMLRNDERFTLLELSENVGFGRANNRAAQIAKGDMIFLLNPDTILLNDAVTILEHYMYDNMKVGICGGNLFDENMQPAHSFHRMRPSILSEMDFAAKQIYRKLRFGSNAQFNHTDRPLAVQMITGADLMIRHNVWEELQGFDEKFFMYYEDADLCLRCMQRGYNVVSVPSAMIQHLEGRSFMETKAHCRRILSGRKIFFSKHYSGPYNMVADILNVVSLSCAVVLSFIVGRRVEQSNYLTRLKAYIELV